MTSPNPPQRENYVPADPVPAQTITLTPAFKFIFICAFILTVLSLVGCFVLILTEPQKSSEDRSRLVEACSTTWKLGFGAVIGLIGGKVA